MSEPNSRRGLGLMSALGLGGARSDKTSVTALPHDRASDASSELAPSGERVRPMPSGEPARQDSPPDLDEGASGVSVSGWGPITPFVRLARTHALHAAGDAVVAIALAGSLFFSIDPSAARSRVLLYLVCTLAPFALVGPLIGPALDRMRGGRRLMILTTFLARATLVVLMIPNIDSLWLFPIAFAQLVMGKTYAVAKAAMVPGTVRRVEELVDKNARLALLSAVAGFAGAAPAAGIQRFFGSSATLGYAFVIYLVGLLAAYKLNRTQVADQAISKTEAEIRGGGVRLAASAMSVLRGVVGFMFFMFAFAFRGGADDKDLSGVGTAAGAALKMALGFDLNDGLGEPAWKLGMPLAFWGGGILLGNYVAPRLRQRFGEETLILVGLCGILGASVAATWAGGLNGALLLALVVGAAPSVAKLAFDSLVQRDAPGANHGAAFGRFETRFQVAWVLGALVPVILRIPLRLGFAVVAAASLFAALTYFLGFRTTRDGLYPTPGPVTRLVAMVKGKPGPPAEDVAQGDTDPSDDPKSASAKVGPGKGSVPETAGSSEPRAMPDRAGGTRSPLSDSRVETTDRPKVGRGTNWQDPYGEGFAEDRLELPHWMNQEESDNAYIPDDANFSSDPDPTPPYGTPAV